MESILGIFKIGIGPSSSHTMGPWKAAIRFREQIQEENSDLNGYRITVDLYGSLALTGKGHGTDFAIYMGLNGFDIATIEDGDIVAHLSHYESSSHLSIDQSRIIFSAVANINFWKNETLPFHSNGMTFRLIDALDRLVCSRTYFSVGGGFVVEEDTLTTNGVSTEEDIFLDTTHILKLHEQSGKSLYQLILERESSFHSTEMIESYLAEVFDVMLTAVYTGCQKGGILPGGLQVARRAKVIHDKLIPRTEYQDATEWLNLIKNHTYDFRDTLEWINCFALAVNEQNASFGRVVTAPTNGASGVIPAVLLYIITQLKIPNQKEAIQEFLLVCAYIGMLYKKGATLSAAAGGCQAEIGVSASMAAGGLAAIQGASLEQVFMAAEIAMEHHLGLTCDPINGLVQVPCIERNSIGAVKAITSAQLAMSSEPSNAKVSLEEVIDVMWETAQDMSHKYKETSLGGLAVNVLLPEC